MDFSLHRSKGIIVLDGPDACGKTTLAGHIKEICSAHNVPYYYQHANYKFKNRMFNYHEVIVKRAAEFVENYNGIAVIDRLHFSEMIYSKIFRGGSKWPLQYRYFERLINTYAGIQVICAPDNPQQALVWHKKAKQERAEMFDTRIDDIAQEFINIYNKFHMRNDFYFYNRMLFHNSQKTKIKYFIEGMLRNVTMRREKQFSPALNPNNKKILGYIPDVKVFIIVANFEYKEKFYQEEKKNKYLQRHPMWGHQGNSLKFTQLLEELDQSELELGFVRFDLDEENDNFLDLLAYYEEVIQNKFCYLVTNPTIGRRISRYKLKKNIFNQYSFTPSFFKYDNSKEILGKLIYNTKRKM